MCVVVAVVVELFMLLFFFVSFLAKCVDPYKTILTQQSPTVPPSSSHNLFASQYLDLINIKQQTLCVHFRGGDCNIWFFHHLWVGKQF